MGSEDFNGLFCGYAKCACCYIRSRLRDWQTGDRLDGDLRSSLRRCAAEAANAGAVTPLPRESEHLRQWSNEDRTGGVRVREFWWRPGAEEELLRAAGFGV